jgi:[acyl-carrier-protein] S-malonyltransferase
MALAILCSGQGRQHPDMFALTADAPEAAGLFAHAAKLLGGKDPRDFVRSGSDEALHRNRAGQILCALQALAAAAALGVDIPRGAIVAGYSFVDFPMNISIACASTTAQRSPSSIPAMLL